MIILPALVLVVLVVLFAAAGGMSLMRDDGTPGAPGREGLLGGAGPALALGAGAVVVVLVLAVAVLGFGLRGGGDHEEEEGVAPASTVTTTTTTSPPDTTTTTATTTTTTTTTAAVAPAAGARGGVELGPRVVLARPSGDAFAGPPPVVDRLAPATVLRLHVTGFPPDTTGSVAQCVEVDGSLRACRDRFPVRFDGGGAAEVQYLVTAGDGSACRLADPPCVVAVSGEDGPPATARTLFVDAVPAAGTVTVEPRAGIDDGETVVVSVRGFPPGSRATAVLCAPPVVSDRNCGRPGPEAAFIVGPDGAGSVPLPLRAGAVGTGHRPCGRDTRCAVAVVGATAGGVAPVVPVSFSAGASATYDPVRLAAGLAVAALLAGAAVGLVRTTDWRAPTEAGTPDLDAAVLDES